MKDIVISIENENSLGKICYLRKIHFKYILYG